MRPILIAFTMIAAMFFNSAALAQTEEKNDTVATLRYLEQAYDIYVVAVETDGENGTTVEVWGNFDLKVSDENVPGSAMNIILKVLDVRILAGGQELEAKNLIVTKGGFQSNFERGKGTRMKAEGFRFVFGPTAPPEKIIIRNDENSSAAFDPRTRKVIP